MNYIYQLFDSSIVSHILFSVSGVCTTSIRLNNNGEILFKGSGRLELCQNGAWGTVNNNMFSVKDSLVACRQLGVGAPCKSIIFSMLLKSKAIFFCT